MLATEILNREMRPIKFKGASGRGNRSFLCLSTGHEVGIMHVQGMHGHDFHEAIANVDGNRKGLACLAVLAQSVESHRTCFRPIELLGLMAALPVPKRG